MRSAIVLFIILGMAFQSPAEQRTVPRQELPPLGERGLRFRIDLPKSLYFVAEPVVCEFWIENTTAVEQLYFELSSRDLMLYDVSGKQARTCGERDSDIRIQRVDSLGRIQVESQVLHPFGMSVVSSRDLLADFGNRAGLHCGYLPVGSYYLTCPKIQADTVRFEVVMPTDARSLAALALFDSASFAITPAEFASQGNKGRRNIIDSEIYRYDLLCRLLSEYPDIYFRKRAEHQARIAAVYSKLRSAPTIIDSLPISPLRELLVGAMGSKGDIAYKSLYILYVDEGDFELYRDTPELRTTLESLSLDHNSVVAKRAVRLLGFLDSRSN